MNWKTVGKSKQRNKELQTLTFPIGQKRETFTRTQDSVLYSIYDKIVKSNALTVARKDKKLSLVNLDFVSKDELFCEIVCRNIDERNLSVL